MDFLKKNYGGLIFLVTAILVTFACFIYYSADPFDKTAEAAAANTSVNLLLAVGYVLMFVVGGGAIVFSLISIAKNKVGRIRFAIGAGALGLIFWIAYGSASDDVEALSLFNKSNVTPGEVQLAGGVLTSLIILAIVGFVAFAGLEIYRLLKGNVIK